MKTMKNIFIASIASLTMAVSFVPVTAFAADSAAPEEIIFFDDVKAPDSEIIIFENQDTEVKSSFTLEEICEEIQRMYDQGYTYEETGSRAMQMCNDDGELQYYSIMVLQQVYGLYE